MEIARLQIAVDATQVQKGAKEVDKLAASAGKAEKSASALGKAIGAAAVALTTGAIATFVKQSIDLADAAAKAAQSAGVTTEALTGLQFAAGLAGVSSGQLSDSLRFLNVNAVAAASGSDKQAKAFERLGVSVRGANGEVKTADVLLKEVATSFAGYEDGAAKAALAQEIFGRSGAQLIPFLNSGAEGIEELTAQAERLGLVIDTQTAKAAEQFNDSLSVLGSVARGSGNQVMAGLLPALNDLTGTMIELADETDIANTAADIIGGTLKGLASVAIVVGAAFKTTGQAIGATAAALMQAATGDFKGAWETIKAGSSDYVDSAGDALSRLQRLWDGSAGKTAETAARTSKALKQLSVETEASAEKPQKQIKALSKTLSEAERAAIANAKAVSDLAEALYQATLPADELAKRQAELRLNEYASAEQIAQVRSLAGELQRLQDIESRKREFGSDPSATIRGNVSPLSGGAFDDQLARFDAERQTEERRYAEQQARLQEALELELITRQQYADLEVEMKQVTADRIAQIEMARNDMMLTSASNAFGQMSTDLMAFAQTFGEEQKEMFAIAKAAAIAQTIIQTYQSAQQAFTAMSAIPIVGPALGAVAAAAAIAGGMARVSAISSQSPSFDGGGYTGDGSRTGGVDGKGGFWAVMHPQETVVDHTRGQSMPGRSGGGVTNNFILQGRPDNRTQAQIAMAASMSQSRSAARFG